MILTNLSLTNFRSFAKKQLSFTPQVTLIIGANASGKTNILEAIFLLATGKSFRAGKEIEMICSGAELGQIQSKIEQVGGEQKGNLEVMLTNGVIQEKIVGKKLYKVNGVNRRWKDFVGNLHCVLFRPEDIDLISGSPSLRRDYLDAILEQADWQYRACNLAYKKGLRQRNKLLSGIREGEAQKFQLTFWNQLLIKNGEIITQKRAALLEFFNNFLAACDRLYKDNHRVEIIYDKSTINQARLDKYIEAEIALGVTLVGPHRDDLKFKSRPCSEMVGAPDSENFDDSRDLTSYGSRGEQRMAILAMKLAELEFMHKKTGQRPTLLLDDIFSELDQEHREQIFKIIPNQQTIITATDAETIDGELHDKITLIRL